MTNRSLFAKVEVRSSLRSDAIVITTDGRSDRHSSNVLRYRADQMSPSNLGPQINISMRTTRIDKTNIPSMRVIHGKTRFFRNDFVKMISKNVVFVDTNVFSDIWQNKMLFKTGLKKTSFCS